ncbi:MAG: hypothetical protein WCO00_02685 [Rhodospirillaceae bacterium]
MPYMDRAGFIDLLERLGSENDTEVLAAAREIQRRIQAAEVGWHELLVLAPGAAPLDPFEDEDDPAAGAGGFEIRDRRREPEPPLPELPPLPERLAVTYAEDLNLIDSLLRRVSLNRETRRELMDLRADIAADDFAEMDRAYLRDLAARLNARERED